VPTKVSTVVCKLATAPFISALKSFISSPKFSTRSLSVSCEDDNLLVSLAVASSTFVLRVKNWLSLVVMRSSSRWSEAWMFPNVEALVA
jgi:hypothetical protein